MKSCFLRKKNFCFSSRIDSILDTHMVLIFIFPKNSSVICRFVRNEAISSQRQATDRNSTIEYSTKTSLGLVLI